MVISYLDTSAALKLFVNEADSEAARKYLSSPSLDKVSSWLLYTEMYCALQRRQPGIPVIGLTPLFDGMELVELTHEDLMFATRFGPLRSNDAIHLATAMRIGADEIVTYDQELAEAAERTGIRAVSPRR